MYGKEFYIHSLYICMLNAIKFYDISFLVKKNLTFLRFSLPTSQELIIIDTPCCLSVSSSVVYTWYKLSARTSLRMSSLIQIKLNRISIWTESGHRNTKVHKPCSYSFHYITWIIIWKKKTVNKSYVIIFGRNYVCISLINKRTRYCAAPNFNFKCDSWSILSI